jgi:hypothetical protein
MCPVYVFSNLYSYIPLLKRFKVEFDLGHEATDGTPLQSMSSLIPLGRIARHWLKRTHVGITGGFCSDRRVEYIISPHMRIRGIDLCCRSHLQRNVRRRLERR